MSVTDTPAPAAHTPVPAAHTPASVTDTLAPAVHTVASVAELVATAGYDAAALAQGKALFDEVVDLHAAQKKEYGEQYQATEALDAAWTDGSKTSGPWPKSSSSPGPSFWKN